MLPWCVATVALVLPLPAMPPATSCRRAGAAPVMVDFTGQWQMDLAASDALGPLLRELGLNRVVAALVGRLSVQQSITQDSDGVTVRVKTAVSEDTLDLRFDGSVVAARGISGGAASCASRWLDEACTRLETRQTLDGADLSGGDVVAALQRDAFVTVRSLRDGGAQLVEECSLVRDGISLPQPRAQRVLRREA